MGVFQNNLMGAAAAAASAGGGDFYDHQIANSVRLGDSGYLKRTPSGAGNRATWTFSTWIKLSQLGLNSNADQPGAILNAGTSGNQDGFYRLNYETTKLFSSSAEANFFFSTGLYRDTSAWYHVVWKQGGGTATVYVNGVAAPGATASVSGNTAVNNNVIHCIGGASNSLGEKPLKGYLAETIMIDGTALGPDSFGEEKNGVWIPKDASGLTFGTNGFHLDYASSSDLGNDVSGNNNDWTSVNLATHDQMLDSPTFNSDSNGGNFATYNPLSPTSNGAVFTEGNLKSSPASSWSATTYIKTTMAIPKDKKIYFEASDAGSAGGLYSIGVAIESGVPSGTNVGGAGSVTLYDTEKYVNGTGSGSWITGASAGDIIQVAVDGATGKVWLGINNTWGGSGNPSAGSNEAGTITNTANEDLLPVVCQNASSNLVLNFGQDGTFAGAKTAQGNADGTGYGNFYYAPPTDFLALCSGNLSVADAVDPAQTDTDYPQKLFSPIIYTGNGGTLAVTGLGFKPDFVSIRRRNAANTPPLYDSSRGNTQLLTTTDTMAEYDQSATPGLSAFGTDGFTVEQPNTGDYGTNRSTALMVAWCQRANGGTTSTNATGSLSVTQQVDPSGSFSISTYNGDGGTDTIGHGLSSAPTMVIVKQRNGANNWAVYAKGVGATKYAYLDSIAAFATAAMWQNTTPSSSLVYLGDNNEVNAGSRTYVAYCFADTEGYCKSGSYVGNGSVDNAFAYTGFKPAFVMTKGISTNGWNIHDDATSPFNVADTVLQPNTADAELTNYNIDILSNGFKVRDADGDLGTNGRTYIYLAFAENPFKYATAR